MLGRVTIASLTLTACAQATSLRFDPAKVYPPRPGDHPIHFYATQAPECPYEEVGRVAVEGDSFVSGDRLAEALRTEARKLGADAVVGFTARIRTTGHAATATETKVKRGSGVEFEVQRGTAVRFKDPACTT